MTKYFSYKKLTITFIIIATFLGLCFILLLEKNNQLPKIAIASYGPHASLDDTIRGIVDGLQQHGLQDSRDIKFDKMDVNFDQNMIMQVLTRLRARQPDVFVTLSTPVSQAAKKAIIDVPILFVNVTDPEAANLVHQGEYSSGNITGLSDRQNLAAFLDFVTSIMPEAKKIGMLYSTSEVNDISLLDMMKEAAKVYDMEVIAVPIDSQRDIPLRMQRFSSDPVDLIYVGTSGYIQPSLPAIVAQADRLKIPVFNADENAVKENLVVASFGVSHYKIGLAASNIIVQLLDGVNPASIPIIYPQLSDHVCFINKKKAAAFNIKIPENLDNVTVVD